MRVFHFRKTKLNGFLCLLLSIWIPLCVRSLATTKSNASRTRTASKATKLVRHARKTTTAEHLMSKSCADKGKAPNLPQPTSSDESSNNRRAFLQGLALATVALPTLPAQAGKPQYDKVTGELYTPKAEMLSGGSAAARGIDVETSFQRARLQPGQALQTVYETRFIAYLSRFLLNFDPAANAWWGQNVGLGDTWDLSVRTDLTDKATRAKIDATFAEFAESVEIGLADYFVGPYGSYSSLQAAAAGITASKQVKSSRPDDPQGVLGWMGEFFMGRKKKEIMAKDRDAIAKQGVLNLYTLLKARYTSDSAKRQLAILFSFFSNPDLQPTSEIRSLLGEADDAKLSTIDFVKPMSKTESNSRTSSRRGGGYDVHSPPEVNIEPPPALGASYKPATAKAVMRPTSRVLRIRVLDGGEGYTKAPEVFLTSGAQKQCSACAILDREGRVDSILVLDPGFGYGKKRGQPPKVTIASPDIKKAKDKNITVVPRRATAVADLEYEIADIDIIEGGNGYVSTEPPAVTITPPQGDPDWYVESPELAILESEVGPVGAKISTMLYPDGTIAYSAGQRRPPTKVSLQLIQNEPTELLPSSVRPELNSIGSYVIPPVVAIATYGTSPNPRYRAVDPIFGAIGSVPVTKSALELKTSEYGRLALSGAVCTVLVRTALNPLELIKTKQQLQNDEELLKFAADAMQKSAQETRDDMKGKSDDVDDREQKIGSLDLIKSLIELRGPLALFQSADITFLASIMFGSFGFGATELFRRSFTAVFFSESGGGGNSEIVLLLAATIATIITSAAAAPFELLRVRSMGLVSNKKWTEVLVDFLDEKSSNGSAPKAKKGVEARGELSLSALKPKDVLPLWAGFAPTASRELAFAIPKFLAFDIIAKAITAAINSQAEVGSLPVQVGVGSTGLIVSAVSGALAGLAGAFVSHPADLILTYTSASKKKVSDDGTEDSGADWKDVVKGLLEKEGGISNLFVGLPPRLVFFFLVIGLQFFLYDYVKTLLNVGSDDLNLVLDVFYAVRRGLAEAAQ